MSVYIDQMGRPVELPASPRSIVSLVPSITELLYTLQLDDQVTGITKFCIHPNNWFREKTRVGGTKAIKTSVIQELRPDLIIANKEENVKEQVEELAQHYPVWVTDVNNLADAMEMIEQIGAITSTQSRATRLISQINAAFSDLQNKNRDVKTGYLIWRNPYMTIGSDTFIHDMLGRCGFKNIFDHTTRYPAIDTWQLAQCDLLLLSSEPYPFQQKHIDELQAELPNTRIILVDGEMFSWYGSRLLHAPAYFTSLLQQL
ncbi:cobalamin-binding protein [Niastella yeongjuensis]|uniref:Cobalamin-binding protein n=1 Tax=Niastella yeongjuensis TaxID=354355 RepID=A0A1V9EAQ4_9BACT|nr:helical backbone metal receptor [Niastella yeongjuensis]OQP43176.1 cobalamin-binding protein [Niastella yeongjuensis]SEO69423.1 ABC-type Fe3+-hydroxamate transport system, substrate-binding protein [Niastella yeongjuensis]